jgi:hypothetical protein
MSNVIEIRVVVSEIEDAVRQDSHIMRSFYAFRANSSLRNFTEYCDNETLRNAYSHVTRVSIELCNKVHAAVD